MVSATSISFAPDHASGIMAKVEIYTSMMCPYCSRAVRLLQAKNVRFNKIDVSMCSESRQTMRSRAGGRTSVPQIFIDYRLSLLLQP